MKKQIGQEDPSHQNLGILRRLAAQARVNIPQVLQDLVRDGYVVEVEYDDSNIGRYFNFYAPDYESFLCVYAEKPREYWVNLAVGRYEGSAGKLAKLFRAYVDGDLPEMERIAAKLEQQ